MLIVERNFKAAIISDAFKIQKYSRDKSEFYHSGTALKSRKLHKLTSESSSSHSSSKSSSNSNSEHSKKEDSIEYDNKTVSDLGVTAKSRKSVMIT